jgi:hypothetical protein
LVQALLPVFAMLEQCHFHIGKASGELLYNF